MSRFNAKISLTGRTHRVNISTAGDHIHLMLLPVLLLLLCSLILIPGHHTCLRLKMESQGFYWNHISRYGGGKQTSYSAPHPQASPNNDNHSTDLQSLLHTLGCTNSLSQWLQIWNHTRVSPFHPVSENGWGGSRQVGHQAHFKLPG